LTILLVMTSKYQAWLSSLVGIKAEQLLNSTESFHFSTNISMRRIAESSNEFRRKRDGQSGILPYSDSRHI
jgi:hypothetical protein